MQPDTSYCQCLNKRLLIVNGFCEICMRPTAADYVDIEYAESDQQYGPDYYEALELYLDSQMKEKDETHCNNRPEPSQS